MGTHKAPTRRRRHTEDVVNHPAHYNTGKIEVIDFITDQRLNFCAGNVIKYVVRAPHKNGIEDLLKAEFYLKELIAQANAGKAG